MEIYDHPTFRMAARQFDLVADRLQIPEAERARLKFPKRSLTVALPIRRDDGTTEFSPVTACNIISRLARRRAACAIIPMSNLAKWPRSRCG